MRNTIPLITLILVLLVSCIQLQAQEYENKLVTLRGKKFYLGHEPFYPMVMNHKGVYDKNLDYVWSDDFTNSSTPSQQAFKKQLQDIMDAGFNTIRLVGMEVKVHEEEDQSDPDADPEVHPYLVDRYQDGGALDPSLRLGASYDYEGYFEKLEAIIDQVEEVGQGRLKVILLAGHRGVFNPNVIAEYRTYLDKLGTYFKDNNTIMAYDLCNEPNWNKTTVVRDKNGACEATESCYNTLKLADPRHLITLGTGGDGVSNWDPAITKVDFVSFHHYRYGENDQQMYNKLWYWLSKHYWNPWIIGETAVAGSDRPHRTLNTLYHYDCTELLSLAGQKLFAEQSTAYSKNCGASGYSWWWYGDVDHVSETVDGNCIKFGRGALTGNYHGIFELSQKIDGHNRPKYVIDVDDDDVIDATTPFKLGITQVADQSQCVEPINYHNRNNAKQYSWPNQKEMVGHVFDQFGNPMEGVIVVAQASGTYDVTLDRDLNGQIDDDTDNDDDESHETDERLKISLKSAAVTKSNGHYDIYFTDDYGPLDIHTVEFFFLGANNVKLDNLQATTPVQIQSASMTVERPTSSIHKNGVIKSINQADNLRAVEKVTLENYVLMGDGSTGADVRAMTVEGNVILKPGFHAQKGSSFYTDNGFITFSCTNYSNMAPEEDGDGRADWEDGEEIAVLSEEELNYHGLSFGLYPNPATRAANVEIFSSVGLEGSVAIIDNMGRMVQERPLKVEPGENSFSLDISSLSQGVYTCRIQAGSKTEFHQLLKQ